MDLLVLLWALISLVIGALIGWLSRSGSLAKASSEASEVPSLRREIEDIRQKREIAERQLAAFRSIAEQVTQLEQKLDAERKKSESLSARTAALVQGDVERTQAHHDKIEQLKSMEVRLNTHFGELASKALGEAQSIFLKRADERFRQSEEKSGDNLKALLQPVSDRLQRYEEGVAKIERDRTEAYGVLTGLIGTMREGQDRVQAEAARLVNSLRSAPKARGRWGEQQLRNVLETCGLSEYCDYQTEVSGENDDGRFRPDVIITIPGGRTLVIDAKVSLNAFQDAHGATEEIQRQSFLLSHAASMKAHVNKLGSKSYQSLFSDAADYVVMFVPGEHFLSAALDHDPHLWEYALNLRVLIATPTNLIAIARTVAAVWRQEKLATDAKRIGELGKELYERLAKSANDLKKVGSGLTTAVNNYNNHVASFEGRVLVSARRFRDLNIEPSAREIEEVGPVEVLARYNDSTKDDELVAGNSIVEGQKEAT